MARNSFWCIIKTLEASGFVVKPYQTAVPSFGIWGFALARLEQFDAPRYPPANIGLRFLNESTFASMFEFSSDTSLPKDEEIEINRLDNQALVRYYETEWRKFE
jgi:spermidine synthase